MILAVNIGNTNIRAAVGRKNGPILSRIVFYAQDIEAADMSRKIEEGLGAGVLGLIKGSIVASVVPEHTDIIAASLR